MTGCGAMVVCLLLVGAAGPKARTGLLRADDPRVGACPLVSGAESWVSDVQRYVKRHV